VTFANALNRFGELGYVVQARRGRGGRDRVVLPGAAIGELAGIERRLAESRRVADATRGIWVVGSVGTSRTGVGALSA
jgi:hypothetical protein